MIARNIESGIRNVHILNEHHGETNSHHIALRLIFLRIGEIDTKAEKFHAHIAIEARWFFDDEENFLDHNDRQRLQRGETVKLPKNFSETHWHPQLFLLNVDHKRDEEIKYSMKKTNQRIEIREFRDVHGDFHCKFDLHHFPTDIQQLSVSIGSALFDDEVTLETDLNRSSGINREAFVDQQEWKLYDHIETKTRFLRGFLFQNDEDNELDTPGHDHKRSILTISCHAARRSSYFLWNGYCLIFLITIISFTSFAIPPNGVQFRLAISCTLLLTSIAFRWTMSNALPSISYLTMIDRYAIVSMFVLIILATWHSIIGTLIFLNNLYTSLHPSSYWTWLDRNLFFALVSLYLFIHLIIIIWYYYVPSARRRQMEQLDRHYRERTRENLQRALSNSKSMINEEENA